MKKITIDILLCITIVVIVRAVYSGITTGRVHLKMGKVCIKKEKPVMYLVAIIVQSLIVVGLIYCLLMNQYT